MLHAADMAATDAVEALGAMMPPAHLGAFGGLHSAVMALDFERAERLAQAVLEGAAGETS